MDGLDGGREVLWGRGEERTVAKVSSENRSGQEEVMG